jgi:GH15 family glucan-1,4-alpha-glucosidase
MVGTVAAIQRHLVRNGFVDRYPTLPHVDGLPPGEGTFPLCTFWLADNLALLGRKDEAHELGEPRNGIDSSKVKLTSSLFTFPLDQEANQ